MNQAPPVGEVAGQLIQLADSWLPTQAAVLSDMGLVDEDGDNASYLTAVRRL